MMGKCGSFLQVLLLVSLLLSSVFKQADADSQQSKPYIVYMGKSVFSTHEDAHKAHHDILLNVFEEVEHALGAVVYNYRHGFNGFAARLTLSQAQSLKELPEVLAVYPSVRHEIHTTRSWEYLGLNASEPQGLWQEAEYGSDVIVGVIDSGIWPESPSFNDDGFSPVPARWRGTCVEGDVSSENFTTHCNNKLIGARYYIKGYESNPRYNASTDQTLWRSPRDTDGHGTHTASTVLGRRVENASFYGLAAGIATGGAPRARLAVYKVCWTNGCDTADELAAFDDAISDGVDMISISIGGRAREDYSYFTDGIGLGSFHAAQNGILVSASAGNRGPTLASIANVAPWMITVAATNTDRSFSSQITLGDGLFQLQGVGLNVYDTLHKLADKSYPLVYAGDIANANYSNDDARMCVSGALNVSLAQGKIILCGGHANWMDEAVTAVGGLGMISTSDRFMDSSIYDFSSSKLQYNENLASTGVTVVDGQFIYNYTMTSSTPTALLGDGVTIITPGKTPNTAEFSSRGPNSVTPDILKPDLSAPGVDILAAWTGAVSPFGEFDTRRVQYNIISGTSMACPHVTGAAALIKSKHPSWSPAAIKSALMTTAEPMLETTDGVIGYGAGNINVIKAADPGLIFDTTFADYVSFLCASGDQYNNASIQQILGENFACPITLPPINGLNYPSIAVSDFSGPSLIDRTVTNVGSSNSVYTWSLEFPIPNVVVTVYPETLAFTELGEKKSFSVLIVPQDTLLHEYGFLIWTDETYKVRIPISLEPPTPPPPAS